MSEEDKTTSQGGAPILADAEHQQIHGKGKAKAVEDMDMDDDSSSEEEEQVGRTQDSFAINIC